MINHPKRLFAALVFAGGFLASLLMTSGSSKALEVDTVEGAKQIIENLVQEGLPGPAGEFITVLQNSPNILKFGLRGWLRKKMLDAIYNGDVDKFDKYSSFYSCISNKDCKGAGRLQNQARAAIGSASGDGGGSRKAGAGKFKILQVFLPKTVKSGGKKGSLTVFWRGSAKFPITMVYRPRRGRCAKGINCSTVKETFASGDLGSLQRLPLLMPEGVVREMAYTGQKIDAGQALEYGLVNRVFKNHDDMMDGVNSLARQIAAKSPLAVSATKKAFNHAHNHGLRDALEYVGVLQAGVLAPEDISGAVKAKLSNANAEFSDLPTLLMGQDKKKRK